MFVAGFHFETRPALPIAKMARESIIVSAYVWRKDRLSRV
jgi:hypothetical protein